MKKQDRSVEDHNAKMKKIKVAMDKRIAKADEERGVIVLITGNGKGKSSSGFGMVIRAIGHDLNAAVVQFIKGVQSCGEQIFLAKHSPECEQHAMKTGFTWDSQDKTGDIKAAEETWIHAKRLLKDESINLVLLDELTYMVSYGYLDEAEILDALVNRPPLQNVIVTGRGASESLIEISDTVSEIQEVKHAFKDGVKAQKGVEF